MHLPALLSLLLPVAQDFPVLSGTEPSATPDEPSPAVVESSACARCHSNASTATAMRDSRGREVGAFNLWRSTMMANAALDPYWRAAVSVERAATPSRAEDIAKKCLHCHAPMASVLGLPDHGEGSVMHALECDGRLGDLARDGVSCTVCHGMLPEGLGTDASFTGHFVLDPQHRMFGPHQDPFAMPMRNMTGFTPTHGPHVLESAACGSCHTLETAALDEHGEAVGAVHLEQSPYLEWRNSVFQDEVNAGPEAASCADCHLPTSDADGQAIRTRIVRNPMGRDWPPTSPREPFGRHQMIGGNTQVLSLLAGHAERLGVAAPVEAFEETIAAIRRQLATNTARLAIGNLRRTDGRARFDVKVENLTGHKLPTGHPSRRAWLRTVVRDEIGVVLFLSGSTDSMGRIVDAKGEVLPMDRAGGPVPRHRDRVEGPADVPVYQGVMEGPDGEPTHLLLRATEWWSDNRLLPRGFRMDHPEAARTAPVGTEDDPDFTGGSDTVHYDLAVPGDGPLLIEVTLLYESAGARWLAETFEWDTPEVQALKEMWTATRPGPEVLATARLGGV